MPPEPAPAPDHPEGIRPATDVRALPVLVYDGDCGFCQRCADWIAPRLVVDAAVVASQRAPLAALGLNPEQAADAAWWIDGDGTQHRGHLAITAALGACGGSWARLGRTLTWPGISLLAAGVYELVARNRHRLGCKSCLEKTRRGGPAISD
ncbi:MAG: DCC1-like thiol-disulfide oxidoreductase family protein [bacterium]|nr:DCC1-like thiol-disulfide oxidoreductase family protein [bacterium]